MSQHVTVTTRVAVEPAEAFARFTGEIGAWWAAGTVDGTRFQGELQFEPGPGGRLLKHVGDRAFEIGRIAIWEPPLRFAFECREEGSPEGVCTEVEVCFAAEGRGTRVTLEHRGFEKLPPEHSARAGLPHEALMRLWGRCWAHRLAQGRACAERAGQTR